MQLPLPAAPATPPTPSPVTARIALTPPPVTSPFDRLHAAAASTTNQCPMCGMAFSTRAKLGKHLTSCPSAVDAATSASLRASLAFTTCPAGCNGAYCLLPKRSVNGFSNFHNHLTQNASAHSAIKVAHNNTFKDAVDAARAECVALAPAGSLGASMAPLVSATDGRPPLTDGREKSMS